MRPSESIQELSFRLERLSPTELGVLAAARATARELSVPLWCVGGAVRDLLLDRGAPDLDFLVEGDLAVFVGELAGRLGATIRHRTEFRTATLALADGSEHDFAAPRRERYPHPGALPEVTPAPDLAADLERRDFSINALALALEPRAEPPRLVDRSGGLADLDAGRLRVLHDRSFSDDPTRVVRGLRFAARLGFEFDSATERLARQALDGGALATLSGVRLRQALDLAFGESRATLLRFADRAAAIGLWSAVFGDTGASFAEFGDRLRRCFEDDASEPDSDPTAVSSRAIAWLALFLSLPPAARRTAAERLEFPAELRDRLADSDHRLGGARDVVERQRPAHEMHEALADLDPAELRVLAATSSARVVEATRRETADWRRFRLAIDGDDLVAAGVRPGPRIGEALRRTRSARLDGTIGRESELEYALATLGREPVEEIRR